MPTVPEAGRGAERRRASGCARARGRGFTLTELLVVVIIIGILAAIGVPRLTSYFNVAKLDEAKPYLGAIASAQRRGYNESRRLPVDSATTDEAVLVSTLGVEVTSSADFCYLVRPAPGDWLWSGGALAPDATVPEFEVWAVLRSAGASTSGVTGGTSCTTVTNKLARNAAWSDDAGEPFSEGRVVVLHYPAPPDGLQGNLEWVSGITISDAAR